MRHYLRDVSLLREAALVAGKWIAAESAENFAVHNPATGEVIGYMPICRADMAEEAIIAAQAAQKLWAAETALARAAVLYRWRDLILENKEDLSKIITAENGKPLAESLFEVEYAVSFVEWYAEEGRRVYGRTIPSPERGSHIMVTKQPIGVTAAITPWNFPCAMVMRKAAPALAAGCAFILKPAELTPFSAAALAVLAERAGFPAGLLSVITGVPEEIGAVFTGSSSVRKLSFTGSTATGRKLYAQSASTIKKISLELGGNAPFIVFDDADIEKAVKAAIRDKFMNNGQVCLDVNRFYVQDKIYDDFAQCFKDAVSALKLGNGMEEGVTTGPLINQAALQRVQAYIADAVDKGAKILLGGVQSALGGNFFEPTILTEATSAMRIAKEEIFGPVAPLFRFYDENEVINYANDTHYGLASYFYTQDIARIFRVAQALEYGMTGINGGTIFAVEAPFGGVKYSGFGREGSHEGIEEFLELKYICIGDIL